MFAPVRYYLLSRPSYPNCLPYIPQILCLSGFLVSTILYFPGEWTWDASVQQAQAISGLYGDWHPPVMAATWRGLNGLFNTICGTHYTGSGLLFLLYNMMLWGGGALVLSAANPFWRELGQYSRFRSLVPLGILAILICSDFISWSSIISKDNGMLGAYLIVVGLLLRQKKNQISFPWGMLIILLIFYGTALRHNAIFTIIPLLMWFSCFLFKKKNWGKVLAATLVFWLTILVALHITNTTFLRVVRLYPLQERYYADIFLLNYITGVYVPPPDTFGNSFTDLDEKTFNELYQQNTYVVTAFNKINEVIPQKFRLMHNIILRPGKNPTPEVRKMTEYTGLGKKDFPILLEVVYEDDIRETYANDYDKLRNAWIERISMHPAAYVKLRLKTFYYFCTESGLNFLGINTWVLMIMLAFSMFFPLLHFRDLLNSRSFPQTMLGIAAFFYILPYLIFLTSEINRYVYWPLITSIISLILYCRESKLIRSIMGSISEHWEMILSNQGNTLSSQADQAKEISK